MMSSTTTPCLEPHLATVTLLDVKTVARVLRISQRQVWRLSALAEAGHGNFPRPVRLGPKTIRWRLRDIEAYLAALTGEGRNG